MRPRLGTHVQARRHLVGDRACVVLHDAKRGRRMVIGEREWRVLSAMDGTRDVEGLAAAARVPTAMATEFVSQLGALGLFDDPAPEPAAMPARDVPVRALPGYRFRCTGAGRCCALVDSVLFTPLDAARARAAAPAVLDGGFDEARAFAPERGLDRTLLAVAMRDGACAYLEADGRCGVYAVRPHGCRTFPLRHVDVGSEIRVAPRVACACELEPGDEPITRATRGGELPPEQWVERLPERVTLGSEGVRGPDAIAWTDALDWSGDVYETCVLHADALGAAPLDRATLRARIERIAEQHAWRSEQDAIRVALAQLRVAVDRAEGRGVEADERLAARAHAFVGGLATEGDVGLALRGLEARLFLARRLPDEARATHPIALVNAVARATGLLPT